jgi:uncharacterized protein (TIGR02996 family)
MLDERYLRGVLAAPDDDAPRLAFAQAAQDAGDRERAEFIRIQVEYVQYLRAGSHGRFEPFQRERQLESTHRKEWAGPIETRVRAYNFGRGFVERISMDAREFLSSAAELYELAPIRRLILRNAADVSEELFASPHLDRIVSLAFEGPPIGDDGARRLAASPHVRKLAWLSLERSNITSTGLEALAASTNLPGLQYVNFFGNPVELDATEHVGEENGQVVWIEVGLTEIEKRHGRKVWLHPVEDHGYRKVVEPEF